MVRFKAWCMLFEFAKAISTGSIYIMNICNRKMKEIVYRR